MLGVEVLAVAFIIDDEPELAPDVVVGVGWEEPVAGPLVETGLEVPGGGIAAGGVVVPCGVPEDDWIWRAI